MKNLKLMMWAVALSAFSVASFAQSEHSSARRFSVGLNVCLSFPLGKEPKDLRNKEDLTLAAFSSNFFPVGIQFRYNFSEHWFANVNYAYNVGSERSVEGVAGRPLAGVERFSASMNTALLGAGYVFTTGKFKPFIGLDAGLAFSSLGFKVNVSSFGLPASSVDIKANVTSFVLAPKVGFDYFFSEHWFLTVQAQYSFISGGKLQWEALGRSDGDLYASHLFGLGVGIAYQF